MITYGCTVFRDAKAIDSSSPRKFGATYMTMNNPYFDILNDGIKEVVEANGDFLITRDPAQDQEKQNNQIYEMIEEGVAAVFLNPVDWKAVEPALVACKEAGIPVFNVDTYVYNTEYVASVIASDNYNAGVQCAQDMMSKLDSADIVILDEPKVNSIIQRINGFLDTIQGNENYNIVVQEAAGGELEVAMEVMNHILETGVSFDVVMGGNDPTAIGAVAALESQHMDKKFLIYGVDGSPDGKMMIKEGYLEGTSSQQPSAIGTIAAEVAYDYLKGEEVEKNIVVPVTLVTNDNLDDFAIDGWQ
jgi:ribose transport system substrate-binding protein